MGRSGAELNSGRKWERYEAPSRKAAYIPPSRRVAYASEAPAKAENEYHPTAPLKTLTGAEIRAITLVVVIVTAVAIGIIMLAAEAAVAQKGINDLKRNIAAVDDDIANLRIEIEQSQNMQLIKIRAQEELGLRVPSFDQYVYVNELDDPGSEFGRYIKERAYGGARTQAPEPEAE